MVIVSEVEQCKHPNLRGQPTAVVQYDSWKGGGLIAVGYEARKFGVKRSMRDDEAKKICPEIRLVQVPMARGKADLSVYRNAGSEDGLNARDCVWEWFLMNNGDRRDKLLACGALIVAELGPEVLKVTEFTCSASIAHNKLGGKLGTSLETELGVNIVRDLLQFSEESLQERHGRNTGLSST